MVCLEETPTALVMFLIVETSGHDGIGKTGVFDNRVCGRIPALGIESSKDLSPTKKVWEITWEGAFVDMPPIRGYKAQEMEQRQSLPVVRRASILTPSTSTLHTAVQISIPMFINVSNQLSSITVA
jgi:hypothetical protein